MAICYVVQYPNWIMIYFTQRRVPFALEIYSEAASVKDCLRQTWGQIHLYLKVFTYVFSKYLYLNFRKEKYLYLIAFLKYMTFLNTFKYLFKYIVSINISVTRSPLMPVKLITFTGTSPNSDNYWWRHLTAGVPMALAVTTTFVCSEPEDGLASDSDHRSISPLFFSQTPSWHQAILVFWLTLKLSCHTSSQDPSSH